MQTVKVNLNLLESLLLEFKLSAELELLEALKES